MASSSASGGDGLLLGPPEELSVLGALGWKTPAAGLPGCVTAPEFLGSVVYPAVVLAPVSAARHPDYKCDHPPPSLCSWDGLQEEVLKFLDQLPRQGSYYRMVELKPVSANGRLDIASTLDIIHGWTGDKVGCGFAVIGAPDMHADYLDDDGTVDGSGLHASTLLIGAVERSDQLACLEAGQIAAEMNTSGTSHFWAVLGRLHELMVLSKAMYGVLSTVDYAWCCFRDAAQGSLALSRPIKREEFKFAYIWYLMDSAIKVQVPHKLGVPVNVGRSIDVGKLRAFMRSSFQDALSSAAAKLTVHKAANKARSLKSKIWSGKTHSKLKFWNLDQTFQLGRHVQRQRRCSVVYASYNGQPVVLKIRDLGNLKYTFEEHLEFFATEILAYKNLKPLQGDGIPRLLEFGIASGSMLGVLVLSDAGMYRQLSTGSEVKAATKVLKKIHDLGICHGDFDHEDILVKNSAPLKIFMVGFSKAVCMDALEERKAGKSRKIVIAEEERVRAICGEAVDDVSDSSYE